MPSRNQADPATMLAARLYGPADLRVERLPHPGPPGPGEVLLRVQVTGICGSDLHSYADARIGDTVIQSPLILGHEFAGVVEEVGADAVDGCFQPLRPRHARGRRSGPALPSLRVVRTRASQPLPQSAILQQSSL